MTNFLKKASLIVFIMAFGLIGVSYGQAPEENNKIFSIITGGSGGSYYPLAGLFARVLSRPFGTDDSCFNRPYCGISGFVFVVRSSKGSLENIESLENKNADSAFVQADALTEYLKNKKKTDLRLIAHLYPEALHLIVRKNANIHTIKDLVGKRVSLSQKQSGTYTMASHLLNSIGLLKGQKIKISYLTTGQAYDALLEGKLDAFFLTSAYPTPIIHDILSTNKVEILSIQGPKIDAFLKKNKVYKKITIPKGAYSLLGPIETLSVDALWVTTNKVGSSLLQKTKKILQSKKTKAYLLKQNPKIKTLTFYKKGDDTLVPIHKGLLTDLKR